MIINHQHHHFLLLDILHHIMFQFLEVEERANVYHLKGNSTFSLSLLLEHMRHGVVRDREIQILQPQVHSVLS